MKLLVALLIALGLGWWVDNRRKQTVLAPGLDDGDRPAKPGSDLASRVATLVEEQSGAAMRAADPIADRLSAAADKVAGHATVATDKTVGHASAVAGTVAGHASVVADKVAEHASDVAGKAAGHAATAIDAGQAAVGTLREHVPGLGRAAVAAGDVAGDIATSVSGLAAERGPGGAADERKPDAPADGSPGTAPAGAPPVPEHEDPPMADPAPADLTPTPEAPEIAGDGEDLVLAESTAGRAAPADRPAGAVDGKAGHHHANAPAGAVTSGDGACPESHPVKGNANSRIYHVPGGGSYEQTIPEFCFASPEAAEAAGFRAPRR